MILFHQRAEFVTISNLPGHLLTVVVCSEPYPSYPTAFPHCCIKRGRKNLERIKSRGVTRDGNVIPRKFQRKTVFPAKSARRYLFPRDSGNTGNERKSQTWRRELPVLWGLQTCFCSKTTINMASMVSFSFRSFFFACGWIWERGKCLWRLKNTEMKTTFDAALTLTTTWQIGNR